MSLGTHTTSRQKSTQEFIPEFEMDEFQFIVVSHELEFRVQSSEFINELFAAQISETSTSNCEEIPGK